jgi:hypothetical protein
VGRIGLNENQIGPNMIDVTSSLLDTEMVADLVFYHVVRVRIGAMFHKIARSISAPEIWAAKTPVGGPYWS